MRIIKSLIYIIAMLVLVAPLFAEQAGFDPFPLNRGTIYEYTEENTPDTCFFPIDKARWDGYKVTIGDWKKLTDYQKFCFVSEGVEEIKRKGHVFLHEIVVPRTVIGLNESVKILKESKQTTELPMMMYYIAVLSDGYYLKKAVSNN